ncbi:MAG: cation diffusion facilitator family transporter [Alphaproteobacteria bacterium]|nr:cation diffusion facilitator family transporter [Alphaproteobacteria bacterium]
MASGSKKVIIAALIGNSLIAVTKFIASTITGSAAMMSEGIHSLVDTGNQILLLYGLKRAAKPPDARFPFGHGKEIYFWSFVVAILIFAVGAGISMYEGIQHIIHPPEHMHNAMINYIVLGLAIIFEGGALYYALTEFNKVRGAMGYVEAVQKGKDPSLFVVLFEDCAAMLGLLVALFGVAMAQVTHDPFWDGLASVIIGLILAFTAIWLAYETKSLLIGEGASPEIIQDIKKLAEKYGCVKDINEVLTLHMGPEFLLVTISAHFDDNLPAGKMETVIASITKDIKAGHPFVKKVFIEAESA